LRTKKSILERAVGRRDSFHVEIDGPDDWLQHWLDLLGLTGEPRRNEVMERAGAPCACNDQDPDNRRK
jgi:hypothetical protein